MKIKDGYILSEVAGVTVVAPVSPDHSFRGMLKLNATGKLLWNCLSTGADEDALVHALIEEYEIKENTARADVRAFLERLREYGMIEE